MLETGRIATRLLINSGGVYLHPIDDTFETLQERVCIDEWGQHIIVEPTVSDDFFSFDQGTKFGHLTYDRVHGEVLTCYTFGRVGVDFYNTEQDIGGAWDTLRSGAPEAKEEVIEPGLFINPADGDISGGNMGLQAY